MNMKGLMDVKCMKEINLFYSFTRKTFKIQSCYFFLLPWKIVVAQRMNSSEWCQRSQIQSYLVLSSYFFHAVYHGKIPEVQKLPAESMYLPRSHTGNIFPSWTVVVRRHHVSSREFHLPSCNSAEATSLVVLRMIIKPKVFKSQSDLRSPPQHRFILLCLSQLSLIHWSSQEIHTYLGDRHKSSGHTHLFMIYR